MGDFTPQTADGEVLWHFTMSLDGYVAGPDHDMSWLMTGISTRPGLVDQYVTTTGAVLGGRRGWDAFPGTDNVYLHRVGVDDRTAEASVRYRPRLGQAMSRRTPRVRARAAKPAA